MAGMAGVPRYPGHFVLRKQAVLFLKKKNQKDF
jgi:hypothetical protein